jgi:NAD(P)-dependent dehydrogenase (short-subunit alcohol dehydrogenase family)
MAMSTEAPVVCITGATGALGRTATAAFAGDGARLGLVGTDGGRLETLAAELGLAPDRWAAGVGDLSTAGGTADAIGTVRDKLGPIGTLLHLVGGFAGGTPLADLDPSVLGSMLEQHVWSTFHVVRAVLPDMTTAGRGRIIAITAAATRAPGTKTGAYLAAKAAQETMLRSVAREVAASGVTVNVLAVKAIDAARERMTDPSAKNASWTTPDEIVAVMRFLCSDGAAAINGQRIALDDR